MRAWILYTALRLGLFAVLMAVLYALVSPLLGAGLLSGAIAAVVAALLAFCISYIFFGRLRTRVATELQARQAKPVASDDESAEDAAIGTRDED